METKKNVTKDRSLLKKAVKIKGKDYVLVADRVLYFNEKFPKGSIRTELLTDLGSSKIVMKATVFPDIEMPSRFFTGYSQAVIGEGFINKTAALENCETSCVGRALGMMGIGVIESIASVDEINKSQQQAQVQKRAPIAPKVIKANDDYLQTDPFAPTKPEYKKEIFNLCNDLEPSLKDSKKYRDFVNDTVHLDLSESNYEEIVTRLKSLKLKS